MLEAYIEWLFKMFGRVFWTLAIFFAGALCLYWFFGV